jgi:hypothetical protein
MNLNDQENNNICNQLYFLVIGHAFKLELTYYMTVITNKW